MLLTGTDSSRLDRADELATKLCPLDQIIVKKFDTFKIESLLGPDANVKFDVAQIEASLTHYPHSGKAEFFQGVAKYADKFILHDAFFKTNDEELHE